VAFLAVVAAFVGVTMWSQWTPTVPADAALQTIARATPAGQECLERITNESGWLDLCWEVTQEVDGDPVKDYYALRVYGTASGQTGTGVRWWRVRTNLAADSAPVADGAFQGWSRSRDGACDPAQVADFEIRCGRTRGEYFGVWGYQVTWTCVGCVLADQSEHPVVMHFDVGVPQGEAPAFEVGADFGA
jgi:hypothetical protein